jgi:hypothetical protein
VIFGRHVSNKVEGAVPWPLLVVLLAATTWAACNGDSSPTAPTLPPPTSQGGGGLLSSEVMDAMNDTLQEEYYSFFTYSGVVADFGEVSPFDNIDDAEQRHVNTIGALFASRGLDVPASIWDGSNTPEFDVLTDACAAGKVIELATIAMYQESLLLDLPLDVRTVFLSHLTASVEQHLPAFERCLDRGR